VTILNAGKTSSIGPIPVLFIPMSSGKLFHCEDEHVMNFFLSPFLSELEKAFIDGFEVEYAYDVGRISPHILPSSQR
jgi:hypothetical protein